MTFYDSKLNDFYGKDYENLSSNYEIKIKHQNLYKRTFLTKDFTSFLSTIKSIFSISSENPVIEYLDEENDYISVSNEIDFKYLKNYVVKNKLSPVKIFVSRLDLPKQCFCSNSNIKTITNDNLDESMIIDCTKDINDNLSPMKKEEKQEDSYLNTSFKKNQSSSVVRKRKKIDGDECLNSWLEAARKLCRKNRRMDKDCTIVITYEWNRRVKIQFRKFNNNKFTCKGKVFKIIGFDSNWDFDTATEKFTNFLNFVANYFDKYKCFEGLCLEVNLFKF